MWKASIRHFRTGLRQTRPLIHERLIDALTKLLPDEAETVVSAAAEAAAKAIYRLDCENERAVRVLIKSHVAAGNIGAALAVYARLWRQLEDAYDIEPHKLTQDLITGLRQQQPETVAPPARLRSGALGRSGRTRRQPSVGRRSALPRAVARSGAAIHDRYRRQRRPGAVELEGTVRHFPRLDDDPDVADDRICARSAAISMRNICFMEVFSASAT